MAAFHGALIRGLHSRKTVSARLAWISHGKTRGSMSTASITSQYLWIECRLTSIRRCAPHHAPCSELVCNLFLCNSAGPIVPSEHTLPATQHIAHWTELISIEMHHFS